MNPRINALLSKTHALKHSCYCDWVLNPSHPLSLGNLLQHPIKSFHLLLCVVYCLWTFFLFFTDLFHSFKRHVCVDLSWGQIRASWLCGQMLVNLWKALFVVPFPFRKLKRKLITIKYKTKDVDNGLHQSKTQVNKRILGIFNVGIHLKIYSKKTLTWKITVGHFWPMLCFRRWKYIGNQRVNIPARCCWKGNF